VNDKFRIETQPIKSTFGQSDFPTVSVKSDYVGLTFGQLK